MDQGVSAAGNLLLLLFVASQTSSDSFGEFALTYSVYLIALGLSRAISSESMIVGSQGRYCFRDPQFGYSMAGGLVLGVVAGILSVAASVVLHSQVMAAFGLFLPGLLFQDAARMSLLAFGQPKRALFVDLLWTGAEVVALGGLAFANQDSLVAFMLAWGVPGIVSGLLGVRYLGVGPTFAGLGLRYRELRRFSVRYALEYMSGAGALQCVQLSIAAVLGVAAIGALRGSQTLLGPFNQLLTGLTVGLMPEIVRLAKDRPQALTKVAMAVSVVGALVVAGGSCALSLLPDVVGRHLLGGSWAGASGLIIPAGLSIAGNMAILGPLLGLRACAAARRSLRARLFGSALMVVGALGFLLGGEDLHATIWAITGAVWVSSLLWWWVFIAESRSLRPRRGGKARGRHIADQRVERTA